MKFENIEIIEIDTDKIPVIGDGALIFNPTKYRFEIWQHGRCCGWVDRDLPDSQIAEWIDHNFGPNVHWRLVFRNFVATNRNRK